MRYATPPSDIAHGWVRDVRYLPDFGRYEAAVILRLIAGRTSRDVEVITSVSAHPDEAPNALRQRLVLDAARLLRLSEVGFPTDATAPVAA